MRQLIKLQLNIFVDNLSMKFNFMNNSLDSLENLENFIYFIIKSSIGNS